MHGAYAVDVSTTCFHIHTAVEISSSTDCHYGLYIPNVFSPNGDGINDVWIVSPGGDMEIVTMDCTVYDRWGNAVFNTRAAPVTWNGMRKGIAFNPAVFVYTLDITYRVGAQEFREKLTGDLTLVR
jgi:gliding motility-associated-like protein